MCCTLLDACTGCIDPADELLAGYRQETFLKKGSLYKGVYQTGERWCVCSWLGGRSVKFGTHNTEEEAARAHDKKVLELKGR